jgi:hypothetical protein
MLAVAMARRRSGGKSASCGDTSNSHSDAVSEEMSGGVVPATSGT